MKGGKYTGGEKEGDGKTRRGEAGRQGEKECEYVMGDGMEKDRRRQYEKKETRGRG